MNLRRFPKASLPALLSVWVCSQAWTTVAHADSEAVSRTRAYDLGQILVEKYRLTTPQIADALVFWGTSVTGNVAASRRLVRWKDDPITIAAILVGDAKPETIRFAAATNTLLRSIGRNARYCSQQVDVSEDGAYIPELSAQTCQHSHQDVLLVVDASAVRPTALFHDLRLRSQNSTETAFWADRETAGENAFREASCDDVLDFDPSQSTMVRAVAYLRIGDKGSDSSRLESCIQVLPYLLMGQRPVPSVEGKRQFSPELLELYYSNELREGMTRSEIIQILQP